MSALCRLGLHREIGYAVSTSSGVVVVAHCLRCGRKRDAS